MAEYNCENCAEEKTKYSFGKSFAMLGSYVILLTSLEWFFRGMTGIEKIITS